MTTAARRRTIAFPAISCGIHGYPIPLAAEVAIGTVSDFLTINQTLTQVIFACFGADVLGAFQAALNRRAPP